MVIQSIEKLNGGITSITFNENKYTFWTHAKVVLPQVYKFLKTNFPDSLILPEFNHIDFVVLEKNLPVEVQSTIILGHNDTEKKALAHSYFEQMIEKQIKQNIERYGKCWFFFDSEYFRYLQSETSNSIRTELSWFIKYVKDDLLKVFIVSYEGNIKSVYQEDLKFLVNDENDNSLEKNKIKILSSVLIGYSYTSKEIREFINEKRLIKDKTAFVTWLRKKEQSERKKRLGYILQFMSSLNYLDDFFFRKETEWNRVRSIASFLGIIEYKGGWSLEDHYNVLQYFPGYNENKSFWDSIKHKAFIADDFLILVFKG